MTDRRLLKVLPGGRSSSKPGPDGETGQHPGPHGHYADPYAVPDSRSPAGPAGTPGRQLVPSTGDRGRSRLQLLPPVRDDAERQRPAWSPTLLPAPPVSQALDRPVAFVTSLLAPDVHRPDAGSAASPDTAAGNAASQDGQNDASHHGHNNASHLGHNNASHHGHNDAGHLGHNDASHHGQNNASHLGHNDASHHGHNSAGHRSQAGPSRSHPTAAGRHRRPPQLNAADPELLAKREIRVLWAAQLLSSAGDQFARVAIAVMVYGQTRSPLLTAVAYALTYLPPLLGGPSVTRLAGLAGLAGKLDRRTLMIGLDLARAALVAAMTLPGTQLWSLCALLFAAMLLGAPFSAARAALIRDHAPAGPRWRTGPSPAIGTIGYQAGQALGFLTGAGLVAALQPQRILLIDALTFLASACLITGLVRRRRPHSAELPTGEPPTGEPPIARPTIGSGAGIVARSATLRTLALLGWLASFYVVPECLAAPYAHALGGGTLTVGLLMGAMPAGAVLGVLAFARLIRPPGRAEPLAWLAMLSCVPLIFSALHPPLGVVLALWALAGMGTAYQVGAVVAFIRALGHPDPADPADPDPADPDPAHPGPADVGPAAGGLASSAPADHAGTSALGFAQAGLVATQCLGFVAAGAVAQATGPQAAVALAGLCGLGVSTALTRMRRRAHTGRAGARTLARGVAGLDAVSADR